MHAKLAILRYISIGTFKAEHTNVRVTLLMSTLYGFITRKRAENT